MAKQPAWGGNQRFTLGSSALFKTGIENVLRIAQFGVRGIGMVVVGRFAQGHDRRAIFLSIFRHPSSYVRCRTVKGESIGHSWQNNSEEN